MPSTRMILMGQARMRQAWLEREPASVLMPLDKDAEQHRLTGGRPELVIRVLGAVEVGGRDPGLIESGSGTCSRSWPPISGSARAGPLRKSAGRWAARAGRGQLRPGHRTCRGCGRDEEGRNYFPALGNGRLYTLLGSVGVTWMSSGCLHGVGCVPRMAWLTCGRRWTWCVDSLRRGRSAQLRVG
jgi:hypothetical protein